MTERVDGNYDPAQSDILSADKVVFIGNRYQRRRDAKKHLEVREKIRLQGELGATLAKLNITSNNWNETARGANHDIAGVVFRSKPMVSPYLEARRDLREFLDKAQGVNLRNRFCDPKFLDHLDDQDLFSLKLGSNIFREGVSLMDIEQMKLDRSSEQAISLEDIARINSIFRLRFDPKLLLHLRRPYTQDNMESIIRRVVIYLATQKLARPELKLAIPLSLAPLHERLIHYFDYYTKIIANTAADEETDINLNRVLNYYGPWLDQALGCYIPARLGITPASAIKLYKYRTETSFVLPLYWVLTMRALNFNSSKAYRDNILASDLESLIHPDGGADQIAADKLLVLTDIGNKTDDQLVEANFRAESLLEKFSLYHKSLYADVLNSKDQRLEVINLNAESTLNKITVVFQYKNTAMLVLHFRDGQTRLLLELGKDINNDQRYALYGIPSKLLQNYPHVVPLIIIEILQPLLKQLRLMHPAIEDTSKKAHKPAPIIFPSPKTAQNQQEVMRERVKIEKVKPPRGFMTPIQLVLAEPKLHESTHQPKKFTVLFSKFQIEQSLPKNTPLEVVDQIVRELRNFELGRVILADKIRVSGDWELKSGQYRIFLRHKKGRFYAFVSAGKRNMGDRLFRGIR